MQLHVFTVVSFFSIIGFTYSVDGISERPKNGTDLKRLLKNRNRAEKLACRGVDCSPGRQCAIDEAGQVTCICIKKCNKNDRPICASNGQTFRNKCEMHRYACLAGIHLSKNHSKPCRASESSELSSHKKIRPIVCYEKDRDTIHGNILEWIDMIVTETHKDRFKIIQEKFMAFDDNVDGTLNSVELETLIQTVDTISVLKNITDSDEQDIELIRGLCVDALIESADVNHDWQLNLGELSSFLEEDFSLLKKKCSLDDKEYDDGNAVKKKCNVCVCACGNWVCTAHVCDETRKAGFIVDLIGTEDDDFEMTQAEWEDKLKSLADGTIQISEQYLAPIISESINTGTLNSPVGVKYEEGDEAGVFERLEGGSLKAVDLVEETSDNGKTQLRGFAKKLD